MFSGFDVLAEEMSREIFSFFDFNSNSSIARVCHFFNNLSHDHLFWKKKFFLHFSHVQINAEKEKMGWRELFIQTYLSEYQSIPCAGRYLFSLVKEENVTAIQSSNIKFNDLLLMDKNGFSLIAWARKKSNRKLLDFFYEFIKNNLGENPDLSLLHWAVLCRCSQAEMKKVLEYIDINTASKCHGDSALIMAAKNGFADTAEFLISCHANINFHNRVLHDVLLVAIKWGHKNVVEVLLKHNAEMLFTHLHEAVEKRRVDMVAALLNKGMDVDTLSGGITPLMRAVKNSDMEMVQFLLDNGANINARSINGATPLLLAAEHGHESVAGFLLKRDADTSLALLQAGFNHREFGVIVGDTPLHAAARLGHDEIVGLLLEKNANVAARNEKGQIPAVVAKENCKYRFIQQNLPALVF